jgi:hypothetical protein
MFMWSLLHFKVRYINHVELCGGCIWSQTGLRAYLPVPMAARSKAEDPHSLSASTYTPDEIYTMDHSNLYTLDL